MMERKQRFSIKKLSIGVCSICIGYAFMTGTTARAEELAEPAQAAVSQDQAATVPAETSLPDAQQHVITEEASSLAPLLPVQNQESVPETSSESVGSATEGIDSVSEQVNTPIEEAPTVENQEAVTQDGLAHPAATAETVEAPVSTAAFRQTATQDTANALEALEASKAAFPDTKRVVDMNETEKTSFKTLLLANFETKADEIALKDIVAAPTTLDSQTLPIFTRYLQELRTKAAQEGRTVVTGSPEQIALTAEATRLALNEGSAGLYQDAYLETLAPEAKTIFRTALDKGLLESQPDLTVGQVKEDLNELYRGVLYLQQQYSFDQDLPQRLIFTPETIGQTVVRETAYDRLKAYGRVTVTVPSRAKDQLYLQQNEEQFRTRKIGTYTGTSSVADLVERLAAEKGKSAETYFTEQSQALIGSVTGVSTFEALKTGAPRLILPLLAQGKGVYAATTSGSVTVGLLASYVDQDLSLKTWQKERGEAQPQAKFFDQILTYQQNFIHFLNDVKRQPIPFTVAVDTMYLYSDQGKGAWSPQSGPDAAPAVVNFFAPMKYYDASYSKSKNFNGQSTSDRSMIAFEKRFMDQDLSGISLFTHEMTHSNDEAGLFGGTYQGGGRREGQGAEVYARGIFEVIDNTQTGQADRFNPVFNLNTAITIADTDQRTQALASQTSKQALETYMRNLMDLVAYLEVKEAEVALVTLTPEEKEVYYNTVRQVEPKMVTYASGRAVISTDAERLKDGSTNDSFTPYGKMGAPALTDPTTINDLVDQKAVSGQFIPRAASPFNVNVTTNQYDNVPLLESFYAVSVADSGKNTVGDISFKRHAYEILGWQGWDAFITYLSNQHSGDQAAFAAILADDPQKTWADYKKAQYQRLSALEAKDQLWDSDTLKKELEAAIKKDLAVISTLKTSAEPHWANQANVTEGANPITALASSQGFRNKATNVREVKLAILRKALDYNELSDSVLATPEAPALVSASQTKPVTGTIIYVNNLSNGDGLTPETAIKSLKDALAKAKEGDIIRLVGNVTERSPLVINQAITIDSDQPGNTLWLNEDLTLNADVTIKDLTLNLIKDSRTAGQLNVNASSLTLDNLSTAGAAAPKIVVDGSQGAASLIVQNPRETVLDSVETAGSSTITLDGTTIKVNNGIQTSAVKPGQTQVTTNSNFVSSFKGTADHPISVTFNGAKLADAVLSNAADVTLEGDARVSLSSVEPSHISGDLTLGSQTVLDAQNQSLAIDELRGDGLLQFNSSASLTASQSQGNPTIEFRQANMDYSAYKDKVFVSINRSETTSPVVRLSPLDQTLDKTEDGKWIYKGTVFNDYRVFYSFREDDDSRSAGKLLRNLADHLLPGTDGEDYVAIDQTVTPLWPSETLADPDGVGVWRFVAWSPEVQQITQDDMEFEGIWRYETIRQEVLDFETAYIAVPDQPASYRAEIQGGQPGLKETIILADGSPAETRVVRQPEKRIIAVGTKSDVLRETIAPQTVYQADPAQPADQRTEVLGQAGERVTTTVYQLDPSDGSLTSVTQTETKPTKPTIITVGTQTKLETEILPITTVEILDDQLDENQRVTEFAGKEGLLTRTTVYQLDPQTGILTSNIQTERTEVEAARVRVGTRTTAVRIEPIAYQTVYQEDNTKPYGFREISRPGQTGERQITVTNGLADQGQVIKDPVDEIITLGTQPSVTRRVLDFTTVEQENPQLRRGERKTLAEGRLGEEVLTTSYQLDPASGQLTSVETISRTEPVQAIVEVGTWEAVIPTVSPELTPLPEARIVQEVVPYPITYIDDSSLKLGQEVIEQPGQEGLLERAFIDEQELFSRQIRQPEAAHIRRGTWETSIPADFPLQAEKPEVLIQEDILNFPVHYIEDSSLPIGAEIVEQVGKTGRQTRILINGQEFSREVHEAAETAIIRRGSRPQNTVVTASTASVSDQEATRFRAFTPNAVSSTAVSNIVAAASPANSSYSNQDSPLHSGRPETVLPQTGDSNSLMALYASLLAVLGGTGLLASSKAKKRNNGSWNQ